MCVWVGECGCVCAWGCEWGCGWVVGGGECGGVCVGGGCVRVGGVWVFVEGGYV